MRLRTKAQLLEEALARPSWVQGEVPTSAIRDMRGSRSQRSVALERGTSQALISELEVGTRKLTLKAAGRLAPALGATLEQLMAAEQVGGFNRREEKGSREARGGGRGAGGAAARRAGAARARGGLWPGRVGALPPRPRTPGRERRGALRGAGAIEGGN